MEDTMVRRPDFGLYNYLPYNRRPAIRWPDGARIAVFVAPNIEVYEINPPSNPGYAGWSRPLPDVLYYARRDYGNRAGMARMMEAMDRHGVRGSVSLNVALCDHYPEIIEACNARRWELFSHGIYNTRYLYHLSDDQQRAVITDSRDTIRRSSGQKLDGWLSPSITPTDRTPHLLAEMGLLYTCDYFHDDQPLPLNVDRGRLISMPYSFELNDYIAFISRGMSPAAYLQLIKDQFDQLYDEGAVSGTVLSIPLHPYLIGQPNRVDVLEQALSYITGHSKVWVTTAREIAEHYYAHHYDDAAALAVAGAP